MFLYYLKFLVVAIFVAVQAKESPFEMSSYYRMPPLFALDEYDHCMSDTTINTPTYCLVNSEIIPDASVPLWNQIKTFSSKVKQRFRHDKFIFGKCLNWCSQAKNVSLLMDKVETQIKTFNNVSLRTFSYDFNENETIKAVMHSCVNETFYKNYGLSLITEIEYCDRTGDNLKTDMLDTFFYDFLYIILMLCIASTVYDFYLKKSLPPSLQTNEHYKNNNLGKVNSYLVIFSITRNWYHLTMSSRSTYAKDLQHLNCIKFFLIFGVVLSHTVLILISTPIKNPNFVEKFFNNFYSIIAINSGAMIQLFFTISGFLLTIGITKEFNAANPLRIHNIVKIILLRYLRLITVYGFIFLLEVTTVPKLSNGPLWKYFMYSERHFCRKTWLVNILFLGNYLKTEDPCMLHCWYAATEFQSFIINLLILALILKYPKKKNIIILAGVAICVLLPGLIVYYHKLDGFFYSLPEALKTHYVKSDAFKLYYTPTHMNFGSSFFGLISGFLFIKFKAEKKNFNDRPIIIFCSFIIHVFVVLFTMAGHVFVAWDFPKPSIWAAIYAALLRNLWAVSGVVMIFQFRFGMGWILQEFANSPFFTVYARLAYGASICHLIVLRFIAGNLRELVYLSYTNVVFYFIPILVFSYKFSLVLALAVELPMFAFINTLRTKNIKIK